MVERRDRGGWGLPPVGGDFAKTKRSSMHQVYIEMPRWSLNIKPPGHLLPKALWGVKGTELTTLVVVSIPV